MRYCYVTKIYAYDFIIKDSVIKKGGLFVPDPVLSRYLGFAALLQPVFKAGFENARLQWYN